MNGFFYSGKFVELGRMGRKKLDWPGCHKSREMTEELCLESMNVLAECSLCNVRRRELARIYRARARARARKTGEVDLKA